MIKKFSILNFIFHFFQIFEIFRFYHFSIIFEFLISLEIYMGYWIVLFLLFGIGVICLDGLDFKEDREK